MKKTKIICSIGPASVNPDIMEQMVLKGMNVARINCSHATLEEKQNVVSSVKEVRKRTNQNIAILYDLKGPEFRCGLMENEEIVLEKGNKIRIVKADVIGTTERFTVNHPEAIDSMSVGNIVLLENGLMKLEVISKENDGITCNIINGGKLGCRKSMSVPNVKLAMPFISEQDKNDVIYAALHDADFVAASFVSCKDDVLQIKEILKEHGKENLKIICKIENQHGLDNLDEILNESEGIMVARGDLGTEVRMETLPLIQKDMIKKARSLGKIAIVATEMLESMKKNSRPTRAEISDVANAVIDGADAVMLSGESTVGLYPIETVEFMANICLETENSTNLTHKFNYEQRIGLTQTIATCVVESASLVNAKLIVAPTITGFTARKISNLKPEPLILAACPTEEVARGLALNWGVYPAILPILETVDEVLNESVTKAKEFMNLVQGDCIIIAGGFPTGKAKSTNLMKIEEI